MKKSVALCFLLAYVGLAFGQSSTGNPSYETLVPINAYESVNLGNLSIALNVPLRSKGGPVPVDLGLSANVQLYVLNSALPASTLLAPPFGDGIRVHEAFWRGQLTNAFIGNGVCGGQQSGEYLISEIVDDSGTHHPLPANLKWDVLGCNFPSIDAVATDNSGLELVLPAGSATATVYSRDGASATFTWSVAWSTSNGTVKDTHNNALTITSDTSTFTITDALSATPIFSGPSINPGNYTYTDGTNTVRTILVTTDDTTNLSPAWNLAGSCSFLTNQAINLLHVPLTITYPGTGGAVTFGWEKTAANNFTGRLSTLQVPTGATYTHAYSGGTNNEGFYCDNGSKTLAAATMTISNGTATWTFARTQSGTYPNRTITTTVTKPDGSKTVYTFIGDNTPILTSKVVKDTDGTTVLDTMTYCYDSTIASCNPTPPTQHPGVVRAYRTVPGVAAGKSEVDTVYDSYGNVNEVDTYDFGPTLVSKHYFLRGNFNASTGVCDPAPAHIPAMLCGDQVRDASTALLSATNYTHATTGEVLTAYHYASGSLALPETFTYNANGTLASSTAVDGTQVSYGNTQCNNLLPDHATSSVGTVSMTWDCNLAMPKTTTSLNGLVTTTTYGDSMLRPTQVSDNGGQAPINYTYTSATQMKKSMAFNGTTTVVDVNTKLDSLGRILSMQSHKTPTGNYDTTSYTYDTSARLSGISVPCAISTQGGTCPTLATTLTYDGMGRIKTETVKTTTNGVLTYTYPNGDVNISMTPAPAGEVAKTMQMEYDGLGRLVSSCTVTSTLSGNGSCGQRTAANGYLTKNTLDALGRATQVSRNAQTGGTPLNTTAQYDYLSRVTQQVSPETGTSTFVYDVLPSGCTNGGAVALAGHLNKSTDGAGNTLCYQYLAPSGRIAFIVPVSGPDLARTPQRNFTYNDVTPNFIGRLATESTKFTGAPNPDAVQAFTYDIYGRVTLLQQTSSGLNLNYTNVTATYWDNGQIKTLGGIPGVSDFTFGVDGAGRPYSATSGANTIVSTVAYDSASNPTTVTYGNGDKDTYTWDGASQNMTQYKFTVGAANTTDTGTLTWNPNLTLQKLVVADNLNSGDSQTCTTAHDDIARITGWNCGALWNETYAYSPNYAGNVTKSGSLSFSPGYTASNNRMLAPYTYNANGDMLHDATLSQDYLYDSFGDVVSYAGNVVSYDAFSNMLQKTVGATKTYYLYSPMGKLGSLSSLTAKLNLRIPLPGGGTITYDSAGNEQINHPDFEGSTRLVTNRVARTYVTAFCYGPMGEVYCGTASASQYQGSFQDMSTGLDDFDATRYSGAQGRSITNEGGPNGYVKTNRPF